MKKLAFTFISLFFLLTACQASDSNAITLEEVLSSFEEQQLSLNKSKISKDSNFFGMKLNGVRPFSYELDGKMLLVYIYNIKDEREKGWEDWREKTASVNTVSFNVYETNNVLLFYVYEKDLNIETDSKLQDLVNQLNR
ncbi:hypothetical protein MKY41_00010 [Sporosarcina sp. FSL W7-1349]|uniref:hypothetical protein n=1 Tax=Sporosarcina sp. FSL W7-1349 TaxID=2921561 RepID=UPI0030FD1315